MNSPQICPDCRRPLPSNAPSGICPECLLRQGLGSGVEIGTVTAGVNRGEPPGTGFVPPSVEEIARFFPQLEILAFIGRGGMGAVYRARQTQLDRTVALKILPPGISADAAFAERFTREAKAMAKLNHPGIVTIHDFGQVDGLFYFVMEFVDGGTLRQLLSTTRVSPREALAIVPQICDALQYAHDQGIVHRDVKPENILLDRLGRVKVADFGLAKLVGISSEPVAEGAAASVPALTGAGQVMGTPQYMAPEQRERPQEVDRRADIYSLGVVFYQLLTGELPGRRIQPPSKKVQIDVRLDEVVLRALETEPERRYQQAGEVRSAVETISRTEWVSTDVRAEMIDPAQASQSRQQSWKARVAVVGVRDGKRVVHWPGVALSSSLMGVFFLIGAILPHFLSGHPFPSPYLFPLFLVVISSTMALAIYLGLRKQSIERLVRLDARQRATVPRARVKTPLVEARAGQAARWTARILGTLWALMFLVVFIAEGSPPLPTQPGDVQTQFAALALMLAGVAAGWRRDGLAALLTLGGWALFHVAEGHVPAWSLFHVAAVVGVLFALSWAGRWLATAHDRRRRHRMVTAAAILGFPMLFALLLNLASNRPAPGPVTTTSSPAMFGPEIEGIISQFDGERACFDLDSGKHVVLPDADRMSPDKLRQAGVDLYHSVAQNNLECLDTIDLLLVPLKGASWEQATPGSVVDAISRSQNQQATYRRASASMRPGICAFFNGTSMGVLQNVGVTGRSPRETDSVKFRYRLLSGTATSPFPNDVTGDAQATDVAHRRADEDQKQVAVKPTGKADQSFEPTRRAGRLKSDG